MDVRFQPGWSTATKAKRMKITMPHSSTPRYFRATLATVLAVAVLPVTFLVFAYLDYQSPNWDPYDDSGAVQGLMTIFLAALLAIGYAAAVFPAAARRLHQLHNLRAGPFVKVLALWLVVASALVATVCALLVGDLSLAVPLTFMLFFLSAALCLPFFHFWLWLAK